MKNNSNSTQGQANFPYNVNKCCSLGYWLKDYGYYPKDLPLFTYMDHGVSLFDTIPLHEIENDAPLIFKFSPRLVDVYKRQSAKPVYNVLNPAIHYRLSRGVRQEMDAKGSLFFVAHSTPLIEDLTDWNVLIEDLNRLPEDFRPVDVCLHPVDLKKGLGKIFESGGFKVLCADGIGSNKFMQNFYTNISSYKYALSNLIGSYTFYAVEMGIPFSLFGEEPKYLNHGDSNIERGAYDSYRQQSSYNKAVSLFTGLHTSITAEQRQFVEVELGKNTTISRLKAATLLYKALLISIISKPRNIKYLAHAVIRPCRRIILGKKKSK